MVAAHALRRFHRNFTYIIDYVIGNGFAFNSFACSINIRPAVLSMCSSNEPYNFTRQNTYSTHKFFLSPNKRNSDSFRQGDIHILL